MYSQYSTRYFKQALPVYLHPMLMPEVLVETSLIDTTITASENAQPCQYNNTCGSHRHHVIIIQQLL